MSKCRSKLWKKMVCLAMACAVCFQLCGSTAFAASVNWRLHHSPTGTPGENVLRWNKAVTTTVSPTGFSVRKVGGGAQIWAHTTNGIDANFSQAGSATVSAIVGVKETLSVEYIKYGSSSSSPSGYFTY